MSDSDSDQVAPVNPQPKRRRIIFAPSSINSVPIYSNKVDKCLQFNPTPVVLTRNDIACDHAKGSGFSDARPVPSRDARPVPSRDARPVPSRDACPVPSRDARPIPPRDAHSQFQTNALIITDSEDEEEQQKPRLRTKISDSVGLRSPSPPKTPSRLQVTVSTEVWGAMELDTVGMRTRGRRANLPPVSGPLLTNAKDCDEDIIHIPRPGSPPLEPEDPLVGREIQLKFRCRTEIHRIPVVSSRPLAEAVEVLAFKLKVPPSRLLLLRNEMELSAECSAIQLGLSIADIIDCVVIVEDEQKTQSSDVITVRLQGKDRGSTREYSLHKDAALGSILSQYTASQSTGGGAKLQFLFDGSKIKASQTPAQLDMEDGDVIEVWT